jgi:hypothetical protein
MPRFVIGFETSEYVAVEPVVPPDPPAADYWDGNWLPCNIAVVVQGFRGSVNASLRREEFALFLDRLRALAIDLRGEAVFDTMEGCLSLKLRGDGRGHISATGVVMSSPGAGNRLHFALPEHDQSMLAALIKQLAELQQRYPVIGSPTD